MTSADKVVSQAAHDHGEEAPQRLGHLLKHAYLDFVALMTASLSSLDITPHEWAALVHFTDAKPRSQAEAAKLLGVDRTTMVSLVDELERKGLVQRRPHAEDRRKNVIELTPAGFALKKRAKPKVEETERHYLRVLSDAQATQLKDSLRLMISDSDS